VIELSNKLWWSACLAGALMVTPVVGADLPVKAPVPVVAPISWTGFYLGGTVGGGWQDVKTSYAATPGNFTALFAAAITDGALPATTSQNSNGILGGLTLGYNVQSGTIVYGLEGDWSWTNFRATSTVNTNIGFYPAITTVTETKTDWLATVRGRLGVLAAPQGLLYVTGGLAIGEVKGSTSVTPVGCAANAFCSAGSASDTRVGWTVGAGGEYAFAQHWSAKLEYLYYDLGSISYSAQEISPAFLPALAGSTLAVRSTVTGSIVRAGLNYRF